MTWQMIASFIGNSLLGAIWIGLALAGVAYLRHIRNELRRANKAREAFYREVVRTLAHLRQETPEDTPRDTPQWPSEEDGE